MQRRQLMLGQSARIGKFPRHAGLQEAQNTGVAVVAWLLAEQSSFTVTNPASEHCYPHLSHERCHNVAREGAIPQ
jgi:hypothetical protein